VRTKLPSAKVHKGSEIDRARELSQRVETLDRARELSQGVEKFEVEVLAVEGD